MSDQKRNLNKEIIGLFSGQASQITIPKLYIEITGSYNKANILNQCIYWSTRSDCKDGWFYKTYSDWFNETHLSESTVRRNLNFLEEHEWIISKVKKVEGLNIKHVKPSIDKVIDSINNLLDKKCPNRSTCPDGEENIQTNCIKSAPTGQVDRLEPVNLTGSSIYTDDYIQKKLTTVNPNPSSSSFFSQKQKEELLTYKLITDQRTEELFISHCEYHAENQTNDMSKYQRFTGLKNILIKLYETQEPFKAKGFDKEPANQEMDSRVPTQEDFNNYKNFVKGYEWVGYWMQKQKRE